MRRVSMFCAVGIALAVLLLCVPAAQATTYTWTALATDNPPYMPDGLWSNGYNWDTWPGNSGNSSGDLYYLNCDQVDGYPTNKLVVDSANPKGSWQLGFNWDTYDPPFTVTATNGHYLDTTGGTVGINADGIQLNMYLPIQGSGNVSISNGTVYFSPTDSNTYLGSTIINAGATLAAPNYTSLPGYNVSGMVDVKGGATLSIGSGWSAGQMSDLLTYANWESGSSFGLDTTNGDVTTSASLTGLNLAISGTHTLYLAGGTVTNGSLVVKGGTMNASDPIVGTTSVNVYGGAAAILSGSNTYSGGTTVNGTLTAMNRGALPNWNVPGKLTVNGTLILGVGDNASGYFGAADVTTALGLSGFAAGATIGFDTTGAAGGFTYSPALTGHPVVKQGANTLDLYGSMNQAITVNGGTMNVHNDVNFTYYAQVNVNTGALNFMGNNVGSIAKLNVASGGTLTVGGSNYGPLEINGGQLNLNNGAAPHSSGIFFLDLTNATLDNTSGSPVTLTALGSPVMQGAGVTFLGSNDLTFSLPSGGFSNIFNGNGGYGSGGHVWTMNVVQGNLTTANLRTSGFGAGDQIVKTGNGTWTLTGTPYDYEEPFVFTVNAGALVADSMVAFFNKGNESGGIVVNSGGAVGGRLGGPGGPGMSAIDLTTLRGNVTWAATGASLAIDTTNGDYDYADDLPDPAGVSLGMTKLGPNKLIFSTTKSYTGPTTISRRHAATQRRRTRLRRRDQQRRLGVQLHHRHDDRGQQHLRRRNPHQERRRHDGPLRRQPHLHRPDHDHSRYARGGRSGRTRFVGRQRSGHPGRQGRLGLHRTD